MSLAAWNIERDRALLWVAATDSFVPAALREWQRINLDDAIQGSQPTLSVPPSGYSVIFEATCNSALNYDPVVEARAVRAYFRRSPDVLVAVVAPTLEVPVAAQHAIAYEAFQAMGSRRLDVVTAVARQSPQTVSKLRKARTTGTQRDWTALDDALEIARGRKSGDQADQTARTLVYAYTSRARLRNPFRCTPLQKEILHVLALAEIPPTTSAIAKKVYRTENKVYDAISELADALVPHGAGEQDRRDSRERLYWLTQNYGVWIRLVDQRHQLGG